jgi:predicted PurR-regulated permease PerM
MVKAYLIILSITFVELLIGLSILKVTYALPIAAIVSVLDILPILGTGGVLIPWAIVNLISNDYRSGFGMLILYFTMLIVRNAVEPRIVGHEIGLHPIITITTMYAGLRLFGFIGFIIAPLVTILVKYLNDQGEINLYKK